MGKLSDFFVGAKNNLVPTTRVINYDEVQDRVLKAAVANIDLISGRKGDRQILETDIPVAVKKLAEHYTHIQSKEPEKSPFYGILNKKDVETLAEALPQDKTSPLQSLFHEPRPFDVPCFANSVAVSAIANDSIRECGYLIARNFGGRKSKLDTDVNSNEIKIAKEILAQLESGELENTNPKLAKELKAGGDFTLTNIEAIENFMDSGKNGLCDAGPVRIGGREFNKVFRLPVPLTKRTQEPQRTAKVQRKVIDDMEQVFNATDVAYDRIYVTDCSGWMYVILNDHGDLDDIQPNYQAYFPKGKYNENDSGQVIGVIDIDNSAKEAITDYYKESIKKYVDYAHNTLKSDNDRVSKKIVNDAIDSVNTEKKERTDSSILPSWSTLKSGWVKAAMAAASLGAGMVFKATIGLGIGAGVGLLAGGFSLANYIRYKQRKYDLKPVYQAIGVSTNQAQKIIY